MSLISYRMHCRPQSDAASLPQQRSNESIVRLDTGAQSSTYILGYCCALIKRISVSRGSVC